MAACAPFGNTPDASRGMGSDPAYVDGLLRLPNTPDRSRGMPHKAETAPVANLRVRERDLTMRLN